MNVCYLIFFCISHIKRRTRFIFKGISYLNDKGLQMNLLELSSSLKRFNGKTHYKKIFLNAAELPMACVPLVKTKNDSRGHPKSSFLAFYLLSVDYSLSDKRSSIARYTSSKTSINLTRSKTSLYQAFRRCTLV